LELNNRVRIQIRASQARERVFPPDVRYGHIIEIYND
jgi:hypothetical protein